MKARLHMATTRQPVAVDSQFVMAIVPPMWDEANTMLWLRDGVRIEVEESAEKVALELGWPPSVTRTDNKDLPLV